MSQTVSQQIASTPAAPAAGGQGWSLWHFAGAAALAAVGVLLTLNAWQDVVSYALNDEESSHIMLVGVVAAWLIWVRRGRLRFCRPRGTWIGPVLIGAGWVGLIFGYDHRYDLLWHGGALLVVLGCALSFLGRDVVWRFLPAFLVLAFLMPVPGRVRASLGIPLQNIMAQVTEQLGLVLGFAISRTGNVLMINEQMIEVAEACNGMRMLFAFFLVSYTLAFLAPWKLPVRILLLVAAPLIALALNVVRMVPTVWLYGYADPAWAEQFHDLAGWGMVFGGFFLLLGCLNLLQWAGLQLQQPPARQERDGWSG